jgi:excisionase family DNA binding protein
MLAVMSDDRWLSVAAVARELGLSEPTVRRMAATGRLPAFRFGQRAYSVDRADLRSYMAKCRTDSGDVAGGAAGTEDLAKTG